MVSSQFDKVAHGRLTQRGNPWYGRQLLRATPPKNGAIFDTFFRSRHKRASSFHC